MARKNESEDDYWESSSHIHFSFDDVDRQISVRDPRLSTFLRKDQQLNWPDLLKCDGFAEVVENRSAKDFFPFNMSQIEKEKQASKLHKKFDPFIFQQKKKTNFKVYGPEETVLNMILGLDYFLPKFKGKSEKIALLDAAVKTYDGNCILEVVLYLRDSLKKSIFQREIVNYPDAVNVYLVYLEEDHESDELANMLLLLDKVEEAAILKYETAIMSQHPERKLQLIENCLSTHFQPGVTDPFLRQSVDEHRQILEDQIKLEKLLQEHPLTENEMEYLTNFQELTGRKSVVDSSVLCSLIFCCLFNYNRSESILSFTSPEKIKSSYNLSKKQYAWAVLRALIAARMWLDVNNLFMIKNWLGGTKMRSCIAYSRILEVLFKAKAPNEVLRTYVSYVENEQEKLTLAKKYACHSVVIEILRNNKDRIGLEEYKATLLPDSPEFFIARDILRNQTFRWKN